MENNEEVVMKVSSFLKLVEIQTKVASVIPFLLGVIFALYRYDRFDPLLLALFFISLICVDMATTAINNFMDYKRAYHRSGYNYESHNAIVKDGLSDVQVISTIIILLSFGGVFGITLFIKTDIIVLFIGLVASFIGVIYSFGPIPISRTPFGEVFSGVLMGGFIFFITVYIEIFEKGFLHFYFSGTILHLEINLIELIIIAVVAMPLVLMIANIMLANNICDIEDDVINRRFTLPYFIGRKYAIILFEAFYGLSYLFIAIAIGFGWLPITCILVMITAIPVIKGLKLFKKSQSKAETFIIAVKNFVFIGVIYFATILMSVLIDFFVK